MKSNRLSGHTLYKEGWPCDSQGQPLRIKWEGIGKAKCSCGELSPVLDSDRQRRQWHRDHKNQIRGDQVLEEIDQAGGLAEWQRQQ